MKRRMIMRRTLFSIFYSAGAGCIHGPTRDHPAKFMTTFSLGNVSVNGRRGTFAKI